MDYHTLIGHARFPSFLATIDADIARSYRELRCPKCGGVLDRSDFFRGIGFGITEESGKNARRRNSFCCRVDGCRHRVTPPSLRFTHGKWFLSVMIVFMTAMQHGITPERRAELQKQLGISRQTIARWRVWWRDTFANSAMWRVWRSRCHGVHDDALPDGLLHHFQSSSKSAYHGLLRVCAVVGAWRIADPSALFTIVEGRMAARTFTQFMCAENFKNNE